MLLRNPANHQFVERFWAIINDLDADRIEDATATDRMEDIIEDIATSTNVVDLLNIYGTGTEVEADEVEADDYAMVSAFKICVLLLLGSVAAAVYIIIRGI